MNLESIILTATCLLAATAPAAQTENNTMKNLEDLLPQQGRGNARVAYHGKPIDRMVYEFMEEKGIPGMTMAIVQAPYIPRVAGYGVTDIAEGRLAAVKTLWPAGPISQGFAAVAVMQLFEQGKLRLDDEISAYVAGLPEPWRKVTLRQLLQHSSGIPDYRNAEGYDVSASYTPRQLTELAAEQPMPFASGTGVEQSATNFLLLTEAVEKASGMPYREFVRRNQIERLGLQHTFFGEELAGVPQENTAATNHLHERFKHEAAYINPAETTVGYVEKGGALAEAPRIGSSTLPGFGDIWASAENISHWDIGLAGGVLIEKPENRALIYSPATLADGTVIPAMAGWQFYAHKGLMDIKGGVAGHSVYLSRFTDASELVCVTLMANKEGVDLTNLARRIAAAFDASLAPGADGDVMYTVESQFGADETMARIEQRIGTLGIPVFARFDHGKNAEEVGLELRPAKVIVFGAPKVGTRLMQENPAVAIELPLRIAVWEDAKGSVWAGFPQMQPLAARYGLEKDPTIGKMQELLEQIVTGSGSVY